MCSLRYVARYPSKRQSLCRQIKACGADQQGRSCDDWVSSSPTLNYSCAQLKHYGLHCNGCKLCAHEQTPGKQAVLHHANPYAATANTAGAEDPARVVCASGGGFGTQDTLTKIPPGNIFIHVGAVHGSNTPNTCQDISAFNDWLGTLPHKHKFVVMSNRLKCAAKITHAKLLWQSREGIDLDHDGEFEYVS